MYTTRKQIMESVKAAIDEAVKETKTARRLASMLEMHEATLALVRSGKRGLTPEQCAALAEIIDYDPCKLLALCAIEREKDQAARERLRERFFQPGTRGGAVACLLAATLLLAGGESRASGGGLTRLSEVDKLYIVTRFAAWLWSHAAKLWSRSPQPCYRFAMPA